MVQPWRQTYIAGLIAKEEFFVSQGLFQNLQVLLAKFEDLFRRVNTKTMCFYFLSSLARVRQFEDNIEKSIGHSGPQSMLKIQFATLKYNKE